MKDLNKLYTSAKMVQIIPTLIDPEMAEHLLGHNTNNFRRMRHNTSTKYARDMTHGNWLLSWDCIAFAKDGTLLNGQHRLQAIIDSGIPQICFVMWDCEASDFVGDIGLKRSDHDIAVQTTDFENDALLSNISIGAIKCLYRASFKGHTNSPSVFEVIDLIKAMPHLDKYCEFIKLIIAAPKGVRQAPVIAAIYCAFANTEDEKVVEFAKQLSSGVGSETVVRMRDKLRDLANYSGSQAQEKKMRLVERGIVAFLKDETLTKLYFPEKHAYMLDDIISY